MSRSTYQMAAGRAATASTPTTTDHTAGAFLMATA
jgi:hypothetical protein